MKILAPIGRLFVGLVFLGLGIGHFIFSQHYFKPVEVQPVDTVGITTSKQQSFDMRVPLPPTPVTVAGKPRLIYELYLTNFARVPLVLKHVEILDADNSTILAVVRGNRLDDSFFSLPSVPSENEDSLTIAPGMRGVLYLEITLDEGTIPRSLEHRLAYHVSDEDPRQMAFVKGGRIKVTNKAPVVLAPPLRGGPWAAVYLPSLDRGHRRAFYTLEGRARIPGRFAIDWVKLDENGRFASKNKDEVANWYGYGADVLAVAGGIVAATRDGVPESPTLSDRLDYPHEEAEGNYIILDFGDGRYAFYGHLKPGSIRVESGERVSSGQVIGAVGFTGHAARPQLHFHVADANSFLGAEGLPYTLERFNVLGGYEDFAAFGNEPWIPFDGATESQHIEELPAPNVVIEFGKEKPLR